MNDLHNQMATLSIMDLDTSDTGRGAAKVLPSKLVVRRQSSRFRRRSTINRQKSARRVTATPLALGSSPDPLQLQHEKSTKRRRRPVTWAQKAWRQTIDGRDFEAKSQGQEPSPLSLNKRPVSTDIQAVPALISDADNEATINRSRSTIHSSTGTLPGRNRTASVRSGRPLSSVSRTYSWSSVWSNIPEDELTDPENSMEWTLDDEHEISYPTDGAADADFPFKSLYQFGSISRRDRDDDIDNSSSFSFSSTDVTAEVEPRKRPSNERLLAVRGQLEVRPRRSIALLDHLLEDVNKFQIDEEFAPTLARTRSRPGRTRMAEIRAQQNATDSLTEEDDEPEAVQRQDTQRDSVAKPLASQNPAPVTSRPSTPIQCRPESPGLPRLMIPPPPTSSPPREDPGRHMKGSFSEGHREMNNTIVDTSFATISTIPTNTSATDKNLDSAYSSLDRRRQSFSSLDTVIEVSPGSLQTDAAVVDSDDTVGDFPIIDSEDPIGDWYRNSREHSSDLTLTTSEHELTLSSPKSWSTIEVELPSPAQDISTTSTITPATQAASSANTRVQPARRSPNGPRPMTPSMVASAAKLPTQPIHAHSSSSVSTVLSMSQYGLNQAPDNLFVRNSIRLLDTSHLNNFSSPASAPLPASISDAPIPNAPVRQLSLSSSSANKRISSVPSQTQQPSQQQPQPANSTPIAIKSAAPPPQKRGIRRFFRKVKRVFD
ncbi:hypothetical protein DFS34DRAFT_697915 [Phlyctochytrium arcticum]|nr:hypothetical protein DFS34DRAFT_697915 [Phlyctochytrium arcticum]